MDGKTKRKERNQNSQHVDLHQRSADKRTNIQHRKGGVPEETNDVHYAMHKLGLCRRSRRSRMGVRKHNYPACR